MIDRLQASALKRLLLKFPVVAVLGPRQVGKTTLVKATAPGRRYVTLDDPALAEMAQKQPGELLRGDEPITLDEVQRAPALLRAIKAAVDENRRPGRFLLTGSANISFLSTASESLAGRMAFIELPPLTIRERIGARHDLPTRLLEVDSIDDAEAVLRHLTPAPPLNWERLILRGGYPTPWLEDDGDIRQAWFNGFIRSYLERDVRDLSRLQSLGEFQRFMAQCAYRSGQIYSRADLARDTGVAYTTADNYMNLLQLSYQFTFLTPYFRNLGKRLMKSPKLFALDTGMAGHLQGLARWDDAVHLSRNGPLLETLVVNELRTIFATTAPLAKLHYWATRAGGEIDLVVSWKGRLWPIEIKSGAEVRAASLRSPESFLNDFQKDAPWGAVLYDGASVIRLTSRLLAIPYRIFFS